MPQHLEDEQPRPIDKYRRWTRHGLEEVGLITLYQSPLDTKILILQRFVRLFAYGGCTL